MNFAQRIDFKSIPVLEVARELLGEENKERSIGVEKHFPDHGGLFVNTAKNRWFSHGNGVGGDALNLVCLVKKCDDGTGIRWLKLHGYVPQSEGYARQNGNGFAPHRKPSPQIEHSWQLTIIPTRQEICSFKFSATIRRSPAGLASADPMAEGDG